MILFVIVSESVIISLKCSLIHDYFFFFPIRPFKHYLCQIEKIGDTFHSFLMILRVKRNERQSLEEE